MVSGELLKIVYNLERVPSGEPDDNQLDVWAVALRRGTLAGDQDITWQEVATATLYGMDPHRNALLGESPFDVADAYSSDTAYYFEHVFDAGGELLADVCDEFEWVEGRALFLHDVQVPRPLRRRGYGSLLAADAILTLAPHGTAVFAHPGPTDRQSDDPDDVRRFRSETENTRFLAALGFVPFRDRLWALDLSAGEAIDTLRRSGSGSRSSSATRLREPGGRVSPNGGCGSTGADRSSGQANAAARRRRSSSPGSSGSHGSPGWMTAT